MDEEPDPEVVKPVPERSESSPSRARYALRKEAAEEENRCSGCSLKRTPSQRNRSALALALLGSPNLSPVLQIHRPSEMCIRDRWGTACVSVFGVNTF